MGNRSDEIAQIVMSAIVSRRLQPGCKLSEQTLADVFGVSRAVVRQAVIRLSEDGLVTMERNRGAFVSRLSYREAVEIYDALTILEQGVIAQLSGRLDASGWSGLRQHVEKQREAVEDQNDDLADELGSGFHQMLVRMARNAVVERMHAQLTRRTTLLWSSSNSRLDYCGLHHDHSVLIDLMEAGKVAEAQHLIDSHNRSVVRGYVPDHTAEPTMKAREALEPYVDPEKGLRAI